MQRSEGRARQTERLWDAQIKTAQNRRGRGCKTSVICTSLMFNGCSWIKNFQLLSARWKSRREEGGRDRKRWGGGGGGASEQHIYICISTLHLVIRGKTPLPLEALHILPIFPLHKHYKSNANYLFSLTCIWICQGSSRIVVICSESVWIQTTVRLRMLDFRMWMCSEMLHWSNCLCDTSIPKGLTWRETSSNDTLFRADQRIGRYNQTARSYLTIHRCYNVGFIQCYEAASLWLSRRPLESFKFIVWYHTQALLPNLQTSIDSHWFPKVGKSSIRPFGTVAALHRPVAQLDSVHFDELRGPGIKFQEFEIDFHVIGKWMENHVCRSSCTKNVRQQDEEKQQGEEGFCGHGVYRARYVITNFILTLLSRKGHMRARVDPNYIELISLMMVVFALVAMLWGNESPHPSILQTETAPPT